MADVLLTWVGDRDPEWIDPATGRRRSGPILTLLRARRFDSVRLLFTLFSPVSDFRRRATQLLRICQRELPGMEVRQHPVDLVDVTDYLEVYRATHHACRSILEEPDQEERRYYVYLQPGTGQMQTIWVLLVQSGLLPARMIATVRPDLRAPWQPAWKEVDLSFAELPRVISPDELTRTVGMLQAQNQNLAATVARLEAELAARRAGGVGRGGAGDVGSAIPPGFSLPAYLQAQERFYFLCALEQAGGKAATAARLLGLAPGTFRARAQTLGIRPRQRRAAPAGIRGSR